MDPRTLTPILICLLSLNNNQIAYTIDTSIQQPAKSIRECVGGIFNKEMCPSPSVIQIVGAYDGVSQCYPQCCPQEGDCKEAFDSLSDVESKCNGKTHCDNLEARRANNICQYPSSDFVELLYNCVEISDDVECQNRSIIAEPYADVVFDCHRTTEFKIPMPIRIYQWHSFTEAENAVVESWFGDWSEGKVNEHYRITINNMTAGHYRYEIIVQSSRKPTTTIRVYIDSPVVAENGQPYNRIMRLDDVGEYLHCTPKSSKYPVHYDMAWYKRTNESKYGEVLCYLDGGDIFFVIDCDVQKGFTMDEVFTLKFMKVSYDHAGSFICEVDIYIPTLSEDYQAEVIVTDSTRCTNSHAYEGETVNLQCSVTYRGNGTSVLQITDVNGDVPNYSSQTSIMLSVEDAMLETHEFTLGVSGLPAGNHTYDCRASFPGFNYMENGCQIDVTVGPLTSESPVSDINISADNIYANEGESSALRCTVKIKDNIPGLSIVWSLNGKLISNGLRFEIDQSITEDQNKMVSSLHIKSVYPKDTGTIECVVNVKKQKKISSAMIEIYVLAIPSVEISNYTYTMMERNDLTLTCRSRVERTGHPNDTLPASIVWYRNNQEIKDDNEQGEVINQTCSYPTCVSHLYKSNVEDKNVTYSCDARNDAGSSQKVQCKVVLLRKDVQTCSSDHCGKLTWPKTTAGSTASLPCAGLSSGLSYRKCFENGTWDEPKNDFCVDKAINDLLEEISDMEDGLDADANQTKSVALEFEEVADNLTSASKPIEPGNLNASMAVLEGLAGIHLTLKEPPEDDELQSITDVCSMLIEERNNHSWTKILEKHPYKATIIMSSLEGYGDARTKDTGCGLPLSFSTYSSENIMMTSRSWTEGNGDFIYPKRGVHKDWIQYSHDQVTVTNDTLKQIMKVLNCENIAISSVYYRTLGPLLPEKLRKEKAPVSSRVLAIRVTNLTSAINFDTPLNVLFETKESKQRYERQTYCAFWNYTNENEPESGSWSTDGCNVSFSNDSMTNCQCDHMTNFAILVSSSAVDHEPLSIITYVGCGLSVICMIITTIVYGVLWKHLQVVVRGNSSRGTMLIALCVTLTLANLLFVFGVEQLQPLVLCIIIAAILHYLFLVAFALMLAFSLQLLLKVVWFGHMLQESKKQIRRIVALAFLIPAIIVGVTLAITETQGTQGYISEEVCWLSVDGSVIYAFVGPIAMVIMVNILVMVVVLVTKYKSKASGLTKYSKQAAQRGQMISESLWTIAVLTPMMGITWMIGIFAVNEHTVVLQYLFSILNSAQGVFIFIFHCVLDPSVKKAWNKRFPTRAEKTSLSSPLNTQSRNDI